MTSAKAGQDQQAGTGWVLGVLGASGGVGASALATACAVRAAAAGRQTTLVDVSPWAGGIEILAGTDTVPGLRWPELEGARGDIDPHRLRAELPQGQTGFCCLSWGAHPPQWAPPGPDPVLSSIAAANELTVVDLPRPAAPGQVHRAWWQACDALVLLVQPSVVGIGAAATLSEDLPLLDGVVLRAPVGLSDADLAGALGAPVLARVATDRSVERCLARAEALGSSPGPLSDAADEVLRASLPAIRSAA